MPTIAEAGVPGYEATNWWGILASARTPAQIAEKLNKEIKTLLASAEVQKLFQNEGADVDYIGPAEFGKDFWAGMMLIGIGAAAPEAANNADAQCKFIPMLTLGIPASGTMALMLGALMIHGITPGPTVMTQKPDLFRCSSRSRSALRLTLPRS